MERCCSNIKPILLFQEMETLNNSLYFRKMNFLVLILKTFLYFLKRKLFLYFRKWSPALFIPILKKKKSPPRESFLYSGKVVIFSQKKTALKFQETENLKKVFIFQQTELSHIPGNASFSFFQKGIFRNLVYSEF